MKNKIIAICSIVVGFGLVLLTVLLILNRKVDATCESFDDKSSFTIYGIRKPNTRLNYDLSSYVVDCTDTKIIFDQLDVIYQEDNKYYILNEGYYYEIDIKKDFFVFSNLFARYLSPDTYKTFNFPITMETFSNENVIISYNNLSLGIRSFDQLKKYYEVDIHATIQEHKIIIEPYDYVRHEYNNDTLEITEMNGNLHLELIES